MPISKGTTIQIDDQFSLHVATNHADEIKEIIEFNVRIHGEPVREYLNDILFHHPKSADLHFLYTRDSPLNRFWRRFRLRIYGRGCKNLFRGRYGGHFF